MERIISQNLETNNRKLLELLSASRLAENVRENCDLSDLTYNTLLDNIAHCIYTEVSNVNLPSTDNGITLLHIKMRSINNEKNFDKFEEFLKACMGNLLSLGAKMCIWNLTEDRSRNCDFKCNLGTYFCGVWIVFM